MIFYLKKDDLLKKSAFSLIEAVIAIGIMSFGVLGIMALLPGILNHHRTNSDELISNGILRYVESDIKFLSWNQLRATSTEYEHHAYFDIDGNQIKNSKLAAYVAQIRQGTFSINEDELWSNFFLKIDIIVLSSAKSSHKKIVERPIWISKRQVE